MAFDRMALIGEIRDRIEILYSENRFDLVKAAMGELDRFDFSEVPDEVVQFVWTAFTSGEPDRIVRRAWATWARRAGGPPESVGGEG